MAKNIDQIAAGLGARVVGPVPDTGGGAFGAARLAKIVQPPLTEAGFKQQLLESGLLASLPTPPEPATCRTFQPVTLEGEPLSETIIRERR